MSELQPVNLVGGRVLPENGGVTALSPHSLSRFNGGNLKLPAGSRGPEATAIFMPTFFFEGESGLTAECDSTPIIGSGDL